MESSGGSQLGGKLAELGEGIDNYYGTLAEIKEGIRVDRIEKPEALVLYEQVTYMGIPLVAGGVLDQPHIWIKEYKICSDRVKFWNAVNRQPQEQPNGTSRPI